MASLTAGQEEFRRHVRTLVEDNIGPVAARLDESEDFPRLSYEVFRDAGLLKAALPREHGGLGAKAVTLCILIEEISRVSPSSALLVFPTSALIRILCRVGDPNQKARLLPGFAQGDKLCGFALTEPGSGSDAGSLQARGVLKGDRYVLNGSKTYLTLGEYADYYLVFIRTSKTVGPKGISALILDRRSPGISFSGILGKMGLGASITQTMFLDNVAVSEDDLLLGPERGWEVLSRHANPMRVWGAASMALGIAQGAFDEALAYVRREKELRRPMGRSQAVEFMLADMWTQIEAVRSTVYRTADMVEGERAEQKQIETYVSMSKYLASDMAMQVTTNAVQILGNEGVRRGCTAERMMRDAKAIQIFDGSNQVQRLIVARNLLR